MLLPPSEMRRSQYAGQRLPSKSERPTISRLALAGLGSEKPANAAPNAPSYTSTKMFVLSNAVPSTLTAASKFCSNVVMTLVRSLPSNFSKSRPVVAYRVSTPLAWNVP